MTQEDLAEAANISVDMITKIEIGASGARFPTIERLAGALAVDPAELFSSEIPSGAINRQQFAELSSRLAGLSESDLVWVSGLVDAALGRRGVERKAVVPSPGRRAPRKARRSK